MKETKKWEQFTDAEKAQYILGKEKWTELDTVERFIAVAYVMYGTPNHDGFDRAAAEVGSAYDNYNAALEKVGESHCTTVNFKEDLEYLIWLARNEFAGILFENAWMWFNDEEKAVKELGENYCGGYCEYTDKLTNWDRRGYVAFLDVDSEDFLAH